jgi:hypothetical protein
LAVSINKNRVTTALVHSIYPGDVSCRLSAADADGVGLTGDTAVSNVDVVIACSEIVACITAQCGVSTAGCVVIERRLAIGRVIGAGCVLTERIKTGGRVVVASGAGLERE